MADLTKQTSSKSGSSITFAAATSTGDTFPVGSALYAKNGGTASITLTFPAVQNCDMGHVHDHTVSIAAGAEAVIGGLSTKYVDETTGRITVNYSAVTSVTVAAVDF